MFTDPSEVHVWRVPLDRPSAMIEPLARILSADERQRAERFRFERDCTKFIVARGLLRKVLAQYLEVRPEEVQFSYGDRGKPALSNAYPAGELCFNVSHSHGMALFAIAPNRQVGIDLEQVRPIDAIALSQRFFLPSEAALIRSLTGVAQHRRFFRGWTQKEAYLKATGDGLAGLESVEVSLSDSMGLIKIGGDPQIAAQWSVQEIAVDANPEDLDYIGALVVKDAPPNIAYLSI
jgi:4'-phosphopantetheinyl transferase